MRGSVHSPWCRGGGGGGACRKCMYIPVIVTVSAHQKRQNMQQTIVSRLLRQKPSSLRPARAPQGGRHTLMAGDRPESGPQSGENLGSPAATIRRVALAARRLVSSHAARTSKSAGSLTQRFLPSVCAFPAQNGQRRRRPRIGAVLRCTVRVQSVYSPCIIRLQFAACDPLCRPVLSGLARLSPTLTNAHTARGSNTST